MKKQNKKRGRLFVVSAPSGSGKTTLCAKLLKNYSVGLKLVRSVSATTRKKRKGERHRRHYFFITPEEFTRQRKSGQFLEWARVLGNFYGTPRDFVRRHLRRGRSVLLDIDVQGARKVRREVKDAVFIFILPPSIDELKRRLRRRSTEDHKEITRRLNLARKEIACVKNYDYVVLNDEFNFALARLKQIIQEERER